MAVTQYIGARYVPLFAEPAQWDNTREYEPLTIVLYQGNSFTSRKYVPAGINIENTEYWLETGNYNAQVEQYRREVIAFKNDIEQSIVEWESETIDTITDAVQTKIVTIGDSYGDSADQGADNVWSVELAKRLNLELHNYCEGSAGYVRNGRLGHNFVAEMNNAIADDSFSNNDVRYVVIYGGYNDAETSQNITLFEMNVNAVLELALNNFPKSEILVFGINTGLRPLLLPYSSSEGFTKSKFITYADVIKDCCKEKGVQFCSTTGWMWGHTELYKSDYVHPNNIGRNVIVSQMLAFFGGQQMVTPNLDWSRTQANPSIIYGSLYKDFKVKELKGLNPNRMDVILSAKIKVAFGTNSHDGSNIFILNYARIVPSDVYIPVYIKRPSDTSWSLWGHCCRVENNMTVTKYDTDATIVDSEVKTGPIPFMWDYSDYEYTA